MKEAALSSRFFTTRRLLAQVRQAVLHFYQGTGPALDSIDHRILIPVAKPIRRGCNTAESVVTRSTVTRSKTRRTVTRSKTRTTVVRCLSAIDRQRKTALFRPIPGEQDCACAGRGCDCNLSQTDLSHGYAPFG